MKDKNKKKAKRMYINVIRENEVDTFMATEAEIEKLKNEGCEVVVAEEDTATIQEAVSANSLQCN